MADEPDNLPDAAKLASDMQKAVKAYGEFQTELADAVKLGVSAVVRPFEQVAMTSAQWNAIQEKWQQQCSAIQDAVGISAEMWAEAQTVAISKQLAETQAALARQLAEAVVRPFEQVVTTAAQWNAVQEKWQKQWAETQAALDKQLAEVGPRLRQTFERADHVGQLGWTVTGSMTILDVRTLSGMQLPADADAYMLACYEEVDSDLNRLEKRILRVKELEPFRTPIFQCFTAYRRGDYAITIPCLVAVLERGVRNLGPAEYFFTSKVEKMVKDLYAKAKEDDPRSIRIFVWLSLSAFLQWFYEQYGQTNSGEDRIFRHGIQHGTQPPPNEKTEVLRLLHALDTIAGLSRTEKSHRQPAT